MLLNNTNDMSNEKNRYFIFLQKAVLQLKKLMDSAELFDLSNGGCIIYTKVSLKEYSL